MNSGHSSRTFSNVAASVLIFLVFVFLPPVTPRSSNKITANCLVEFTLNSLPAKRCKVPTNFVLRCCRSASIAVRCAASTAMPTCSILASTRTSGSSVCAYKSPRCTEARCCSSGWRAKKVTAASRAQSRCAASSSTKFNCPLATPDVASNERPTHRSATVPMSYEPEPESAKYAAIAVSYRKVFTSTPLANNPRMMLRASCITTLVEFARASRN